MYLDDVAYFLTVKDIRQQDAEKLTAMMRSKDFFDGLLVPNQDEDDRLHNRISFDCGFKGSIGRIVRSEVDETMHKLAVTFPEATFTLLAENQENKLDQYQVSTHGDLYRCAEMQTIMPALSDPVPFDKRNDAAPASQRNFFNEFLHNTDFNLLYQQKLALLQATSQKGNVPEDVLDGLVNFLDFLGDWAEQEGVFTYPEMSEEEMTVESIMNLAKTKLNESLIVSYHLPDPRFYIEMTVEQGSEDCMNPDEEFYCLKLQFNSSYGVVRNELSGYANYNDWEGLQECCEAALRRYEFLSEHDKKPLDQQISSASSRTPSGTGSHQKDKDQEIT